MCAYGCFDILKCVEGNKDCVFSACVCGISIIIIEILVDDRLQCKHVEFWDEEMYYAIIGFVV
jgi:hypothetical protein